MEALKFRSDDLPKGVRAAEILAGMSDAKVEEFTNAGSQRHLDQSRFTDEADITPHIMTEDDLEAMSKDNEAFEQETENLINGGRGQEGKLLN